MRVKYPNSEDTFYVDDKLNDKIEIMCDIIEKSDGDAVIIADGGEGTGKSNILSIVCYIFSLKLNRRYTSEDIYFDLDEMMKEIQSSKERIFHFDEAALGAMAGDWQNQLQKKFIKMLMIARKRKHIICMAIPQFWRLNRYFAVDRSKALIHTYLQNGRTHGKYSYYTMRGKEMLYDEVKRKRNSFAYRALFTGSKGRGGKHGCFIANSAYHMNKLIDFAAYDRKKDKAIESLCEISTERKVEWEDFFFNQLRDDILNNKKHPQEYYAQRYNRSQSTIQRVMKKDRFKELITPDKNNENSLGNSTITREFLPVNII